MDIEKEIYDYYKEGINRIEIPEPVIPKNRNRITRERLYSIILAAALTLSVIPLLTGLKPPSVLAVKASEFSKYYNLNTIIPKGLLEINKFVSNSLNTGGN